MIKYYCDICKKEITENGVRTKFNCKIIPSPYHTEETDLTVEQIKSLQEENTKLKELLKIACESLKEMADTERNYHGDDIICGDCKYGDCVSLGCEGDYIGECPGFEIDECFVWEHQQEADELLKGGDER